MVRCLPTTARGSSASEITSIYATRIGTITITWSRSSLGVFLLADLCLAPSPVNNDAIYDQLCIRLRPHVAWKRKGSKRHRFTSTAGHRHMVDLAWDLSLASFSRSRGPEPSSGFFVSVAVDGEIVLVVGDCNKGSELISRRERVRFNGIGGQMSYATKGWIEGKEMDISIAVDVGEGKMSVVIDEQIVLEVRRLCWNFRGREEGAIKGGERIQVCWDLYDWLYGGQNGKGKGVLVLRFERSDGGEKHIANGGGGVFWGGRSDYWRSDWSDCSGGSGSSVEELECCEGEVWRSREGRFSLYVFAQKV